jgi:hypothetical protein
MDEQMVDVYYVTARDMNQVLSLRDEAPRHELAKFFIASAADTHAEMVRSRGRGWRDVLVERRSETRKSQHPAHGGDLPPIAK